MHDKSEGKGIINTIRDKVKDVLGAGDNDKSKDKDVHMSSTDYNKNKEKDVHISSGADYNKSKDVGVGSGRADFGSSDISAGHASDKQFSGAAGADYSGAKQTVDTKNLGAEHREVGYDKQSNVIPSKEKDSVHKVDVHGSLYTSGAGSTFKTNEAK